MPRRVAAGARALAGVATDGENQCIALVGAAGAGKSFLARQLQAQLCAGSAGGGQVEDALQRGTAVLEVFGSSVAALTPGLGAAKTSSCFCRATRFYFRTYIAATLKPSHRALKPSRPAPPPRCSKQSLPISHLWRTT